jgi:hypothetical protein
MAYLAQFLGALLITFLVSRGLHVPLGRVRDRSRRAGVVALGTAFICVGIGTFAKGLPWAASLYLPASLVWWVVDLARGRPKRPPTDVPPQA